MSHTPPRQLLLQLPALLITEDQGSLGEVLIVIVFVRVTASVRVVIMVVVSVIFCMFSAPFSLWF